MENRLVYLNAKVGSTATIDEHGQVAIHAHRSASGDEFSQVTLDADSSWCLLQWLVDNHASMLYQLAHREEGQADV